MAKRLQLRGGTTSQHSSFTGAIREVTVDTDKDTLVVHDGSTAGGFPLLRASGAEPLTITTADNLDTLTLISTDADANSGPNLRFYRNSSSPADDDILGRIDFEGRNNNSQDVIYANMQGEIMQEADGSEDGQLQFLVMKAGTMRNVLMLDRVETVFNENSQDIDFRVESNGNANMLFVDGGNNRVGVGTNAPGATLETIGTAGNNFKYATSGTYFSILPEAANGNVSLRYRANAGSAPDLLFKNDGGSEVVRIGNSGNVGIGSSNPTYKLTVQASADNQDLIRLNHPSASTAGAMLGFTTDGTTANNVVTLGVQYSNADFDVINIQRSTQNVGISETAPQGKLHVKTSDSGVSSSPSHSNELVLENSTNGGITFNCGASNSATMTFQNSTNADDGSITYRNSEREFRFKTAGADRMRFHSNGVISSTGGIALGVGTANTASNVLDDYEEGTFTPSLSISSSAAAGFYTKIGNIVHAYFKITTNATGNNITMNGLPFATKGSNPDVIGGARETNTTGRFYQIAASQSNTSAYIFRYDNSNSISSGMVFQGSLIYQTN